MVFKVVRDELHYLKIFRTLFEIELKLLRQSINGDILYTIGHRFQEMKGELGLSNKQFKYILCDMGVCLANAKAYGSRSKLKQFLKEHPCQIIKKKRAKRAGVSAFLVKL